MTPTAAATPESPDIHTPQVASAEKRKVGRPGISYEQVAQAADRLLAAGRTATIDAVREALGNTGGKGTIHKHLKTWAEQHPPTADAVPELPAGLLRDLGRELERVAAEARAKIEEQLIASLATADNLADSLTALETDHEALQEKMAVLTAERDAATTLAEERHNEIQRLIEALSREQAAAEAARIEVAKSQLGLEAATAKSQDLVDLVGKLEKQLEAEKKTGQQAERDLVQAQAQRDAERAALAQAAERERRLETKLEELQAKIDGVRDDAARQIAEAQVASDNRIKEAQTAAAKQLTEAQSKVTEMEKRLLDEHAKATGLETKAAMLETQIAEIKGELKEARASLDDARRYYQQLAKGTGTSAREDEGEQAEAVVPAVKPKRSAAPAKSS